MDVGTSAVTLSAWVKLDLLPAELPETFAGIFHSAPDNYVLYLDRGNNELRFKATNAAGVTTVAAQHPGVCAAGLNTTDWFQVMGVYDGDRGLRRGTDAGYDAFASWNSAICRIAPHLC